MHLKSSCFKFMQSNHFIRSSFTNVFCIVRNEERRSGRIISLSGLVFYKPLYVVPKAFSFQEREDKLQLAKDCAIKIVEPNVCNNDVIEIRYALKDVGSSLLVPGESRCVPLSYCDSCHPSSDTVNLGSILSYSKFDFFDKEFAKPVVVSSPLSLYFVQPPNALGDHCLTSPFKPWGFEKSLLLLSDNNLEKRDGNVEQPEKASEAQLLAVKDHLCNTFINFFVRSHNFSIYRSDVEFQNNINAITTKGLAAYMIQMYLLKFYGHFHYARVKVEILKVTHHTDDCSVRVRWRINGISRKSLMLNCMQLREKSWVDMLRDNAEWLDGFSIFSVDRNGMVYKHVCDKMIPDEEHLASKPVTFRTRLLTLLGLTRRPSPVGGVHSVANCSALCTTNLKPHNKTASVT